MHKVTHSMRPIGGLGNQMFQVACAIGYSIKHGHSPVFNLLKSEHEKSLDYAEHCFHNLPKGFVENASTVTEEEDGLYRNTQLFNSNVSFYGYFQSPRYFVDEDYIAQLLSCSTEDEKDIRKRYADMLKKNTVSIHVRRGDFLSPLTYPDWQPTVPVEYYEKCLSMVKHDMILCFSDDIEWCRRNLNFKNLFFVEGNSSWEDLFLMSLCNNNIMANSTFSWWAAFLNKNKNKRIIFPSKWFGKKCKYKTNDMFPTSWESA